MATVRDLIHASLRTIGAIASGEVCSAAESQDALATLNEMLESWNLENLLLYNTTENVFSLTANTQSYTIGTGGTFNVARPLAIEQAFLRDTSVTPNLDLPMGVLTQEEWADISVKGLTSTYPLWVYLDLAYALATVRVWPKPTANGTLVLWLKQVLSSFASLDTTITLPPGYQRALRTSLALELATEYGRPIPEELAAMASTSKEVIKRANSQAPVLTCDAGVRPGRRGGGATVLRAGGH